ncbi:MAG: hypothetical protein IPL65_11735 [Lewinellaceae bacterium]|nr:hypothetical protein [Lewinellaceae bacterium]
MKRTVVLFFCLLWLFSCENATQKPIDGKTRQVIDSLSGVAQRDAKTVVDSLCQDLNRQEMPRLIDSIKQIRLQEIAEKMKTVPK